MFMLTLPTWMRPGRARRTPGVRVRSVASGDTAALTDLLLSLSERTCYLRYLSRRVFDRVSAQAEARQIIARAQRGIVLAAYQPADPASLLGLAELVADRRHPQVGELALVVRDSHQGCRIGTLLVARIVGKAQQQMSICTLQASTFMENTAMRQVLERLGRAEPIGYDSGILELQVTLGPEDPRLRWVA
jgi:RimJ/RimL family protein N-acetyltransferase